MQQITFDRIRFLIFVTTLLVVALLGCRVSNENELYFGRVTPPVDNVLRYISGAEPESLDPQIGTGQSEQRIYLALFEGLVEYHPQTLEPIPAVAERWETNRDASEFVFYLRKNARWSNGEPITAQDFVFTVRRGLEPSFASRSAGQAYYIRYAKAFNEGALFIQDSATDEFVTEKGLRITVPATEKERAALYQKNPEIERSVIGKRFVPVNAEDVGVEALDDYTVRITLEQSVPFFIKILPHNFFRLIPEKTIKKHGNQWTQPQNIVTSGAFSLKTWTPYHEIVAERNLNYWDAANVQLQQIVFYPVEDQATVMNLYSAGEVDATYNRSVPRSWLFYIQSKKDHQDAREAAIEFYVINITKPPMNDVRVRRAFALALNKKMLTMQRRNAKVLPGLIPPNVFENYPSRSAEEFNPELAKKLLAEAGFRDADNNFDASKFPIDEVAISYNTSDGNRYIAEIVQSQWKQNLGLTIPLKNMETKTFFSTIAKLDYKGFARFGYAADYIDPYSFLSIFATAAGDNGTGWSDERYKKLLDTANLTLDSTERYRLLTEAENLLLSEQPLIPLVTSSTNWLKKPYVKGMFPNPLTLHPWKFVYIERNRNLWETN